MQVSSASTGVAEACQHRHIMHAAITLCALELKDLHMLEEKTKEHLETREWA